MNLPHLLRKCAQCGETRPYRERSCPRCGAFVSVLASAEPDALRKAPRTPQDESSAPGSEDRPSER